MDEWRVRYLIAIRNIEKDRGFNRERVRADTEFLRLSVAVGKHDGLCDPIFGTYETHSLT